MPLRNSPPPRPSSVLVVEDEASIRAMLTKALEAAGYRVDTACDGVEGLARLRANPYDLLICDHQMPKLTGLEMLAQMRSEQISVPTIMASGKFLPGDLINVGIPGLTALMKPYSIIDLLALAKAILPPADHGTDTGIA